VFGVRTYHEKLGGRAFVEHPSYPADAAAAPAG